MKVNAIKCKLCGDTIFSRTVHDYRRCGCGSCAIDGGFNYCKIVGHRCDFDDAVVEVEQTRAQLFDDWNEMKDQYGLIKNETPV